MTGLALLMNHRHTHDFTVMFFNGAQILESNDLIQPAQRCDA